MINFIKNIANLIFKKQLNHLEKYKNIHKGEICYIIGGGISLKWFDLQNFSDKVSIGCNFIPFHNDFDKLNCKYLLLMEPWWFYPYKFLNIKNIKKNYIQSLYRKAIIKFNKKIYLLNISNLPVTFMNKNLIYTSNDNFKNKLKYTHKIDIDDPLAGSLNASISLAIYMGFKECVLVGFDYTHSPSRSLHWFEKGKGFFHEQINYNLVFFKQVRNNIILKTLTLDGESKLLDFVTYENYTKSKPKYKENEFLLNPNILKTLSTWEGYNIY